MYWTRFLICILCVSLVFSAVSSDTHARSANKNVRQKGGRPVVKKKSVRAVQTQKKKKSSTASPTPGAKASPPSASIAPSPTPAFSGQVLAGTAAPLLDFTKADYDRARATQKIIVLYFYANWCPICKKEFPEMQAAFDTLTTARVIGFRVNYNDNATDADEVALAREFGVAYQHTKVLLKDGQRVLKAPDSWDRARYQREIERLLAL